MPGSRITRRSSLDESFQWIWRRLSPGAYSRRRNGSVRSLPRRSGLLVSLSGLCTSGIVTWTEAGNVSGRTVTCAAASVRIFRANRPGRPRSQALRMWTVRRPQCSARNEKRSSAKNSVISPVRSLRTSMRHRTRPGARREAAISPAIMPSFRPPAGSRSESAGSLLHRSTTNPASAASTGTQSAASAAPAWVKAKASAQQAAASSHSSQARSIRFRISF